MSLRKHRTLWIAGAVLGIAFTASVEAQTGTTEEALADSPGALLAAARASAPAAEMRALQSSGGGAASTSRAGKYEKLIYPDEEAQPISARDKFAMGLRDMYSPLNVSGAVLAAGWEQAVNGAPNYGTNRMAFAQRFGAGMARGSSQGLFSDGILAPVFHADPRYYVQGRAHSIAHRSGYAVSRVFVTRTDSGRQTVNAPLLIGYAGAAALTNTYYPQINRNFKDTASDYAGSLGGAALGFLVNEFSGELLKVIHIKNKR